MVLDLDKTDQRQWTFLHYAVVFHRLQVVAVLVSRGARVDIQDSEGKTAMDYASILTEGREEMLAALKGTYKITCQGGNCVVILCFFRRRCL